MKDIHLICCQWGDKKVKSLSGNHGWDRNNIIAGILEGRGGIPGHRILCEEMSPDERRIERGFMKLSKGLQKAFAMKYVFSVLVPPPRGAFWTNRQMAKALDLNKNSFLSNVQRAKSEIKRSEFMT